MRADLLSHRIKVTEIRPGMVETEFSLVRFTAIKSEPTRPIPRRTFDRRGYCGNDRLDSYNYRPT